LRGAACQRGVFNLEAWNQIAVSSSSPRGRKTDDTAAVIARRTEQAFTARA
jgi:hypothetical protein